MILIANIIQVFKIFTNLFEGNEISKGFLLFWWTFNSYGILIPFFVFQFVVAVLWQLSAGVMDGLVIYCVAHMTESFDKLGDEIKEIIDGDFEDKKKKLRKMVEIHCELIESHKKLEKLFGVAIFVLIILSSMAYCILGFIAVYVSSFVKFN
jgi:hypothetical protein